MAVVVPIIPHISTFKPVCFWQQWIEYLHQLRSDYIWSNGRSGGILLDRRDLILNTTTKTIIGITKALLASGADVNHPLAFAERYYEMSFLKRDPEYRRPRLILDATAMFMLEECFNKEPEFRKFATAIEPYIQKPTRRLVSMEFKLKSELGGEHDESAIPSLEECGMLWPLIEKWEKTGKATDFEALQSNIEDVWQAHRPNWQEEMKVLIIEAEDRYKAWREEWDRGRGGE